MSNSAAKDIIALCAKVCKKVGDSLHSELLYDSANVAYELEKGISAITDAEIEAAVGKVVCPVCKGNDADTPCAYPSERMEGCLRDRRLAVAQPDAESVLKNTHCTCDYGEKQGQTPTQIKHADYCPMSVPQGEPKVVGRVEHRADTTQYGILYTHLPKGTKLYAAPPTQPERKQGHSALRFKDGAIERFDPNPSAQPDAEEVQRLKAQVARWEKWGKYACKRFTEETGKDLQTRSSS